MPIRRPFTFVRPLSGLCLCALALLALRGAALAVPAHPKLAQVAQPDGSTVTVRMKGDEYHHWHEDAAGYTVVKDKASRAWMYAEQDASGALRPGAHRVGAADPEKLGLKKALRDAKNAAAGLARRVKADSARRRRAESSPNRVSSSVSAAPGAAAPPSRVQTPILSGTMKNLVILARFSDTPSVYTQAQFNSLFNTAGYNYDGAVGSVKDYYLEVSYGGLTLDSVVTAWVTLPQTAAYYGANDAGGWDLRPKQMVIDAINALDAAGFNFAQCDGNSDGWVDGLTIIHSGRAEELSGNDPNYIWSHQWELDSAVVKDGVSMQMYHTEAEQRGWDDTPGSYGIARIGTICHESGHFLGLPDLYDTDGGSSGLGEFCLMSGGSWTGPGYEGESPAHMSAWPKKYLGWATPTQLTTVGNKTLARSAVDPAAMYLLKDSAFPSGEYFLLENRTAYGFDSYTPGTYRGLLIWHVDENTADNTNPAHYLVDLEEASGTQHLTAGEGVYGDDNDYYRLGNNTFGDSTTPNSRTYNANLPLKLIVNSVSAQGSSMNFYLASTDGTPPSAPAVADGLSTDIDKTGSTSQLSANWTASADAETGVAGYYYAIGTSVGGLDVSGWTGTGTTRSVTRSGLSLVNGATYYFGVKAVNGVGVESTVSWSDGQWVDLNSPADVPYVNDGTATELDHVSSRSRLSAYWGPSPSDGITAYYYAIGSTPGGVDARNWTLVGLQLSTSAVGLSLGEGTTYYFSVKARNASGFESSPVSSDGQLVDVTSPTARVLYSAGTALRPGPFSAKLVVAEANGVAGTPVLQLRTSAGVPVPLTLAYLTGSTWTVTAGLETYHSSGTASFSFSGADQAGNTGTALTGASFTLDTSVSGVSGGSTGNTDGMAVAVPAGAYSANLFISISTVASSRTDPADGASATSNELLAYDLAREFLAVNSAGTPVTVFASPLTLTLSYPDANNDGRIDGDLARESLAWIYYLDETLGKWTPVDGVVRDAAANTLTAQVSHFSVYSVRTAPGAEAGLGGLKAYPNPFDLRTASSLVIAGIPADAAGARIYIYNAAAELVRTLSPGDGMDALNTAAWDGRLKGGGRAASGLYMYLVTTTNYGKGKGKFFLVW
ncbi:MAG: M6 family metalloprotease domain-containing protein [Elusimicrobiales bacterium]